MLFRRNYSYRIYPTGEQQEMLTRWMDVLRFLWNICNEQWLHYLGRYQSPHIHPYKQCKEITQLLKDFPWIKDAPVQPRQAIVLDLYKAWQRCFVGLSSRPRWKRRGEPLRIFSATSACPYKLTGDRRAGELRTYATLGPLKIVLDRPLPSPATSWSIVRKLDEWYAVACLNVDIDTSAPAVNQQVVGIDRGVVCFLADSTGRYVENPRFRKSVEHRIKRLQRAASRKKRGSSNRGKAFHKLARLHRLVARRREVFVETESRRYAEQCSTVAVEALAIDNMTQRGKHKRGLNRAILDSGWGRFATSLRNKVTERGGTVLEVHPAYTSQQCPTCGYTDPGNRSGQAFQCLACGFAGHADVVAAQNIRDRAIAGHAALKRTKKQVGLKGKTAVKPTAVQPVEATQSTGSDETGTGTCEGTHHTTGHFLPNRREFLP